MHRFQWHVIPPCLLVTVFVGSQFLSIELVGLIGLWVFPSPFGGEVTNQRAVVDGPRG